MKWHTYTIICCIDYGWENLHTIQETLATIAGHPESKSKDLDLIEIESFLTKWESAKAAALAAGWEGDFRHEPCVFWLPAANEFHYGFVLKQDNNGATFVVSPFPLPWLIGA